MSNPRGFPLFWLPLACALIPVFAVHVAWWLSVRDGHVPFCIPYLEGCTSISRAARHGLGNHVFQFLMLPCAVLQMLLWTSARAWLRQVHPDPRAGVALPWLGLIAGVFLILYANFLGTDGDLYRLLRRYGVIVYFAMTFLAQLALLRRLRDVALPRGAHATGLFACLAMLALGIASTWASASMVDGALKDALENVLEWNLGVLLTGWFLLLAWLYRAEDLRIALRVRRSVR